jgi:hypothetical protein
LIITIIAIGVLFIGNYYNYIWIGSRFFYVEFASENYGDGNLADSNNKNLGNTPAEIQRNQKLIIAIGVLFIGNYYNYIWIGSRFFQSFLSGFTIAISARTKVLSLTLINPCVILIVVVTHRTTQVKQTMKSMLKTMETTLAIMLNSPQKTMVMAT